MTNPNQQIRIPPAPMALYAALLPPQVVKRVKDFFVYGTDILGVAPNASSTGTLSIQEDSDFFLVDAAAFVVDTAGPTVVDPANVFATVELTDTGSGRQFMDRPIAFSTLYGTAQLPGYWPYPKLLKASGGLSTRFTSLSATLTYDVRISYMGFKLFEQEWTGA